MFGEDRTGMFTFIGGLALLAAVATGLAFVAESRGASTKKVGEIRKEIENNAQIIDHLKVELDGERSHWERVSVRHHAAKRYDELKEEGPKRRAAIGKAKEAKVEFERKIARLEIEFRDYQTEFKSKGRKAATGEQMAELLTRKGRVYKDVTISRVTDDGLEIRHEFGVARVSADELDEAWNERFQWRNPVVVSASQ